jgi:hypothetical protein
VLPPWMNVVQRGLLWTGRSGNADGDCFIPRDCCRCMNVVEKLAENHSAKMTYYLTKFDTAGDEVDRTNVVSQIVQELQGRVKATHALKLHTMYLPERASEEIKAKVCVRT